MMGVETPCSFPVNFHPSFVCFIHMTVKLRFAKLFEHLSQINGNRRKMFKRFCLKKSLSTHFHCLYICCGFIGTGKS